MNRPFDPPLHRRRHSLPTEVTLRGPRAHVRPSTSAAPVRLRLHLLGGFRVWIDGREVAEAAWRLRKAKSLVKLLALAPHHRLHRDQAQDLLWPNLDREAQANNLKQATHWARRALQAGRAGACPALQLQGEILALCPDGPLWIDVEAFEAAAATARRTRDAEAHREALALYAGDLLPEDHYEDWIAGRREALHDLFIDLLVELARLHEVCGEYPPAIEALERVLAHEPAHEEAHVGLMRVHARTGRRQRAAQQYGRLREALRRHAESEPDPVSQRLYQDILARRFPPADLHPAPYPHR